NRSDSPLTRAQSLFLDGHFLLEQTARSRSGHFFHFNGTAGIWRKQCILDAGGWQQDTLTEDLDLSLRAQLKGWTFLYLNDRVTPAELPTTMAGFKAQQFRWAKGTMQTAKKLLPTLWHSPVSLSTKVEGTIQLACHSIYGAMFLLAVLSLFLPWIALPSGLSSAIGWVTLFTASFSALTFFLVSSARLYPRELWKDVLSLPYLLAMGAGMTISNSRAIGEALLGYRSPFVRTPKTGFRDERTQENAGYRAAPSPALLAEMVATLLFTAVSCITVYRGQWEDLPLLLLFTVGFHLVTWPCFSQWWRSHPPDPTPSSAKPLLRASQEKIGTSQTS
ncbi:MAG: glycosyltransferase, partial [Verrucomicrobiota bacterium]